MQGFDGAEKATGITITTSLGVVTTEKLSLLSDNALEIGVVIALVSLIFQMFYSVKTFRLNVRRFDIVDRENRAQLMEKTMQEREEAVARREQLSGGLPPNGGNSKGLHHHRLVTP